MAIVPTPLVGDNSTGLKTKNNKKSKSGEGWHANMTEAREREREKKKGDKQLKAGHY